MLCESGCVSLVEVIVLDINHMSTRTHEILAVSTDVIHPLYSYTPTDCFTPMWGIIALCVRGVRKGRVT